MENLCEISVDSLEDQLEDCECQKFEINVLCPKKLSGSNKSEHCSNTCTYKHQARQIISDDMRLRKYTVTPPSYVGSGNIREASVGKFKSVPSDISTRISQKDAINCRESVTTNSAKVKNSTPAICKGNKKCRRNFVSQSTIRAKNTSYLKMFQERLKIKDLETIGKHSAQILNTENTLSSRFTTGEPTLERDYDLSSCEKCFFSSRSEENSNQDEVPSFESQSKAVCLEKSSVTADTGKLGLAFKKKNRIQYSNVDKLHSSDRIRNFDSLNIASSKEVLPLDTHTNVATVSGNLSSSCMKKSCTALEKKNCICNVNKEKLFIPNKLGSLGPDYAASQEKLENFLRRCSYGNSASAKNRAKLFSITNTQKTNRRIKKINDVAIFNETQQKKMSCKAEKANNVVSFNPSLSGNLKGREIKKKTQKNNPSPSAGSSYKNNASLNIHKPTISQKMHGKDHKDKSNMNLKVLQERHQREVLIAKQIRSEIFKDL